MDKSELRYQLLRHRQSLLREDAVGLNKLITQNLRDFVDWSSIRTLHVYTSQKKLQEVDTSKICQIISKEFPTITITNGSSSKHALIPTSRFDMIIVPVIAFDKNCHRIGFGGGWYDRFLSMQPQAKKIGLAYELQRVKTIPVESHDELLDAVVTEKQTYQPNKNAPA